MFKLVKLAASLVVCSLVASLSRADEIRQMVTGDKPEELLKDYDFSVVSFYKKSDKASVEVDAYMENAKALFESKIADGSWSARGKVGWFRVELDEHSSLAVSENQEPDQMVVGKGLTRFVHFIKMYENKV